MNHLQNTFKGGALVIALAILSTGCGPTTPQAPPPGSLPVPVNTVTAQRQTLGYYDEYPGTVVPMVQVDLRAQVEGYITGIFFTEGGRVKKGQRLYEIDMSKYRATYNQSQANLHVEQANLDQAQKDADRYTYLNEHEAVARQTLEHALTTLQNAKSQVAAAQQDLVRAQTDLNYAVIKAPLDGVIGISQVRVGNTVTPGQTVLNTISSEGAVAVDIAVNEKQLGTFISRQQQVTATNDSTFSLVLPDNTVHNYFGKIYIIDRSVNPQTGAITVRLQFPDPKGQLRAGMSCIVKVRNQDKEPQIVVPARAIIEQMGEYFVYIAKDTTMPAPGADTAKVKTITGTFALQRKVETGATVGDRVIVKKGIVDGEAIIADGV
ncbi:MAG: efflux RND transporter periplasmic adaptor subunit, partial [Chitinophagia bacterium]|nr:efflux RND transporter periplasmic adaptor subunit [Chitinophagia bacterium]